MKTSVLVPVCFLLAALAIPHTLAAQLWPFGKGPYKRGQTVAISGRVVDGQGQPLPEVTVLLEVARRAFKVTKLKRETGNTLQVPTTTDAAGQYRIDWHWDSFYNRFTLLVALPVRLKGQDTYEIYQRYEITERVMGANSADVEIAVQDITALEELRAFLVSVTSEDHQRVYQEMGRPDRVDHGVEDYDPDESWWYFETGKVFRFEDGKLDAMVRFDPVLEE